MTLLHQPEASGARHRKDPEFAGISNMFVVTKQTPWDEFEAQVTIKLMMNRLRYSYRHDASPGKQLSVHQIRRRSGSAFDTLLYPVRWLARFKFILLMNLQDESCQGVLGGLATPEELPILSTGCCVSSWS